MRESGKRRDISKNDGVLVVEIDYIKQKNEQGRDVGRAGQCYYDSEWLSHRCVILVLAECTLLTVTRRSLLKLGLIQVS